MKKILLTGAGAPGGPGIIKALNKAGYSLYTGDCNPLASGRFIHPNFVKLPNANEEDFIPFVLQYCIQNSIDVILPLVTKELLKFSEAKKIFLDHRIKIVVPEADILCIVNDKGKLYRHLLTNNIPVPDFEVVTTVYDLIAAATKMGYPAVPVCIKPTVSNGSRGVRILQKQINEFDLLFHQKPNHLYSTLEKICEILEHKEFPPLVVSEYLPGAEFTVDTIIKNGTPKLILPRSRTKMNGGISIQGTFIKNDQVIAYCHQILCSLNLSGPIGLQVKEDVNGEFKLLEINPRLQGTSVAALGVGINLPALAIQQEFEAIEIDPSSIRWGTSFVRYYEEVFY